jgi:hypothetical protein
VERARHPKSSAVQHELVHTPSGRKLGFGEVAWAAARLSGLPARDSLKLKDAGTVPLHREVRHSA